jgi:hypothetical protein
MGPVQVLVVGFDPVLGLVQLLASLHDAAGNTTVDGLDTTQRWAGAEYPADRFRSEANVLDGAATVVVAALEVVAVRPLAAGT